MHPLRLVILAILIYIGYRLITAGWRKKKSQTLEKTGSPTDPAVNDVLVEDPVCHTLVPKKQAVRLQVGKSMVYFCSEACCDTFVREQGVKK